MRTTIMAASLFILAASTAQADTIRASVDGLVCSFCATGIEKSFQANPDVSNIKVDLDQKLVTITTEGHNDLSDASVTKTITDAGYKVTNISRDAS